MSTPIPNPNPVTPGVCNQYWLAALSISQTTLSATLRPLDPTGKYVIANGSLAHRIRIAPIAADAAASALKTALFAELTSLAGTPAAPKTASILSATIVDADPLGDVTMAVYFSDKSSYTVADVYGLAVSNAAWAAVLTQLLGYLASK